MGLPIEHIPNQLLRASTAPNCRRSWYQGGYGATSWVVAHESGSSVSLSTCFEVNPMHYRIPFKYLLA